jgi:hypothetical protein
MKKYAISPAQLIKLIKNNHLKSSLMNSTSVDQLLKRKEMNKYISLINILFFFSTS